MIRVTILLVSIGMLFPAAIALWSGDRVFTFPTGTGLVEVSRADDLSPSGTIAADATAFKVLGTPDGQKYYVVSRRVADAVIVVDAATLMEIKRIGFGAGIASAVLTPNGEYLLAAAGNLRVLRTDTDEPVGSGIEVGLGPRAIVVNNSSTTAYTLADTGKTLSVIDLESFEVSATVALPAASSIEITPDDSRVLVLVAAGVTQFRTTDLSEIDVIPGTHTIANGALLPLPGGTQVFVLNRGQFPSNVSQVFDLDARTVRRVVSFSTRGLQQVVIVDSDRAFGIEKVTGELLELDLSAAGEVPVTPVDGIAGIQDIELSPNRKTLFLASRSDSTISRFDIATSMIEITTPVQSAPGGESVVYDPSLLSPEVILVHGGDNQFIPAGRSLPAPLSVKVVDSEGVPLFGRPVSFSAQGEEVEVEFLTPQPVVTNSRGIATTGVRIPLPGEVASASLPATSEQEAVHLSSPDVGETIHYLEPSVVEQDEEAIKPILVAASTPGLEPAALQVNLIAASGIIKVSGDFQITGPELPFPEPFRVLATDETGNPLPLGTVLRFSPNLARCVDIFIPTDFSGFAEAVCIGQQTTPGGAAVQDGSMSVTIDGRRDLPTALFKFAIAVSPDGIKLVKVSGDQTAPAGSVLPSPLIFRIESLIGVGAAGLGVRIRQVAGPPALITPTFVKAFSFVDQLVSVTLGPNAGDVVIEAVASLPGFPSVTFGITATGGIPVSFEVKGNGQSGRVGTELPNVLRARFINETGGVVPFPDAAWAVVDGEATLITSADIDGATARVILGDTPGPVRVTATLAGVVATFNLTATAPEPASISTVSGQGQTLMVGGISEPLTVLVNEISGLPAPGLAVTFSGPANVLLHPLDDDGPSANPLEQMTGTDGQAGVKVELLNGVNAGLAGGLRRAQFSSTVVITAAVSDELSTPFSINAIGRAPAFTSDGVVNAATFQPGIVPGSLVSVFGTNLTEGIPGTELAGGATTFEGTTAWFGDIPAPIISITGRPNEQINVQAPFGIPSGQTTSVRVDNNGTQTAVLGIPVFSAQPGIFEIPVEGGISVGAVIHPNTGELVSPANPAA